ncbi:Uncharacterised protein [Mycobacteroides abscessus subsp. abscessus]|uniref:hypothetical protein n=1 Tax=Mycobacteroides abscessus TaxID=36809 RepID=UPI000926C843|nr:hypothetical protein [Mycobacteroides abscessus]SHV14454.1 Uncharacterised protein [Mycobacteroides abscessus subsp. abscessus]SKD11157.1 Uncharacterised protein [Mycobacteroides abscessus subsp. abscessus]SKL36743.1 Uncharacterised protein [Mycobacteroides abscessus subsp. abscessus]SKM28014.1 Uncharacterised protein [Mycobacteroides abscessus subsp. abscessus]
MKTSGSSNTSNNNKKTLLIALGVVVVIALGGIFYWQNDKQLSTADTTGSSQTTGDNVETKNPDLADPGTPAGAEYLILEDWGIKFKLPPKLGEVRYYKVGENYEFSTRKVEALGQQCVEPSNRDYVTRLGYLSRTTKLPDHSVGSISPVNDGQPINGHYYMYGAGQSICSTEGGDVQKADSNLIYEMIKTIEAA